MMSAASCRLPNGLSPGEKEKCQPLKPAPAVSFSSPYDLFRREQQPLQPPGLSIRDREKRLGELPPLPPALAYPLILPLHFRRPALEGAPRDEEGKVQVGPYLPRCVGLRGVAHLGAYLGTVPTSSALPGRSSEGSCGGR